MYYVAGLAAAPAIVATLSEADEDNGFFLEMRRHLLVTEADQIVKDFHESSRGFSLLYNQLFFPVYITGDEVNKVARIKDEADALIKTGSVDRADRIHALPAIAATHALVRTSSDEAEQLRQVVLMSIRSALDVNAAPSQQVLGIVWRNMTAVLIRNEDTWGTFEAGSSIIRAAEDTCVRFLANSSETLVLLSAAVSAWQFLLSYRSALDVRLNAIDLPSVETAIARVKMIRSSRNAWLEALSVEYYNRSSLSSMLPQSYETVIGRSRWPTNSPNRRVGDLFALVGLQMCHFSAQIESGEIQTSYLTDVKQASKLQGDMLTFYSNYGIGTTSDWELLERGVDGSLLSPGTKKFINHTFNNKRDVFHSDIRQKSERAKASIFSKCVPFNQLDEFNASNRAFDEKNLTLAFIGTSRSVAKRLDLWGKAAHFIAGLVAGRANVSYDRIKIDEVLKNSMPVTDDRYEAIFAEQDELATSRAVNRTTFPARSGPAGSGMVQIPVERNQLTVATKPELGPILTQHQARKAATRFILFNVGDRLGVGVPVLSQFSGADAWRIPIILQLDATRSSPIGEIVISVQTGEVVECPTRDELINRVRSPVST